MTERYILMPDIHNPNEFHILDKELDKLYTKNEIEDLLNKQDKIKQLNIPIDEIEDTVADSATEASTTAASGCGSV